MRSLAHEFATQRNATPPRHVSWDSPGPWDGPRHAPVARVAPVAPAAPAVPVALAAPVAPADVGPTRRAVLRRALRMGLLRPAARLRDGR